MTGVIESWREVWRLGFAPVLPTEGLVALRDALRDDDPRLIQGRTVYPSLFADNADRLCEGACALGYASAVKHGGFGTAKVGEVYDLFFGLLRMAMSVTGTRTPAFTIWFDTTPRDEMRRELLAEVELVLAERSKSAAA